MESSACRFMIYESMMLLSRKYLAPLSQIQCTHGLHCTASRSRFKKKWVEMGRKKVQPRELALAYFDTYYPELYGKECWEQMRLALLRRKKKYCVLVNNYANSSETVNDLIAEHLAFDMFTISGNKIKSPCLDRLSPVYDEPAINESDTDGISKSSGVASPSGNKWEDMALDFSESQPSHQPVVYTETAEGFMVPSSLSAAPEAKPYNPPDLYDYIPAEKQYSESEKTEHALQQQQSFLLNSQPVVDVIPNEPLLIPPMLKCHIHERGVAKDFHSPKQDPSTKLLQYYLLDGASVLPVLALDLRPNDKVLDLCAGPGGKSLTIAQTLITEQLVCVDVSRSRLKRLRDVLSWYIPGAFGGDEQISRPVEVMHADGREIGYMQPDRYDKVLVDVPCNTDRLVLHDDENNRFQRTRVTERLQLPELQKHLLISGLRSCKPGGVVVYSTCTMTPGQNDYVIEAAVEELRQCEPDIEVVVQDTSNIRERLEHLFLFWPYSRYGQLVLPTSVANFGPAYFAKLLRVK